jgi:hypothetical protein
MTPAASERRRARRFALHLPVRVVKLRQKAVDIHSETRDVSSVGAFFSVAGQDLPAGAPIEFFVTLESAPNQAVELRCRGRVVRVEEADGEPSVGVGASIDRYQFIRG